MPPFTTDSFYTTSHSLTNNPPTHPLLSPSSHFLQDDEERLGFMEAGAMDGAAASAVPPAALPQQQANSAGTPPTNWANALCRTRHPVAATFHVAFKTSALFIYLFQSALGFSYVGAFIAVTLLLAADFWAVKNVTGRLLVGLRWWNRLTPDGRGNEWIFESSPNHADVPALDRRVFWWALYAAPAAFGLLFVTSFLSLSWDWALVSAVACGLTGANLLGYLKCSGEAQKRLAATLAAAAPAGGPFGGLGQIAASAFAAPGFASFLGGMGGGGGGVGGGGAGGAAASALGAAAAAAVAAANAAAAAGAVGSQAGAGGVGAAGGGVGGGAAGRQTAARSGPGGGVISDFDAVADPFGSRAYAASAQAEHVVI
jgi:hypothetical protein